ncbi:MAG: LysR family transcriptional regulator [Pseudomonadota bacterium]
MSIEDWSLLRSVLAVSRHRGLAGAAKTLGVNQATISRQLAKAEASVGLRFFDRLSTGMQPTRAGLAAIEAAEKIEASILTLDTSLAGFDTGASGMVRLSIPLSIMEHGLADDIAAFRDAYPEIHLEISSDDGLVSLGERSADVAIRAQDKPASGLWGRKLATMEYQFYGSARLCEEWSDALAGRDPGASMPMIQSAGTPPSALDEFKKAFPEARTVVACARLDEYTPLLRRGVGFGLSPCFIASAYPELRMVERARTTRTKALWALLHADLMDTPRFRLLVDFLAQRYAERAPLFATPRHDQPMDASGGDI